ncbi:MAG: thioredoxin family protein, partial [Anaerolineales bacterium]
VFFTDICGTCLAMRPHLHALEAEYWPAIRFLYLDANNPANIEAIERLNIQNTPAFVFMYFYEDVIERWDGAPPLDAFRAAFDAYLAEAG